MKNPEIFWMSIELAHKKEDEINQIIKKWFLNHPIQKQKKDIKHIYVFTDIDLYTWDYEKNSKLEENFFFCKDILLKHKNDTDISQEFIDKKPYFYFMKEMKNVFCISQLHLLFWNDKCQKDFNLNKFKNSCLFNDIKMDKSIIIFLHQKIETLENINHYDIYNYVSNINKNVKMPKFIKMCKKVIIGLNDLFNGVLFPYLDYYTFSNNYNDKKFEFIINFSFEKKVNKIEFDLFTEFNLEYIQLIFTKNKKINKIENEFHFKIPIALSILNENSNFLFLILNDKNKLFHKIYFNETVQNASVCFLNEWNDFLKKDELNNIFSSELKFKLINLKKENWLNLFYKNTLFENKLFENTLFENTLFENTLFEKDLIIINKNNKEYYFFDKNSFLIPNKLKYKNETNQYIYKFKIIQNSILFFNLNDFYLFSIL